MADEIFARFLRDTADHVMWIEKDDGVYRHLKFRHAGSSYRGYYWFDLITVPGSLIFRGDGTSFVFSRTHDMFEFFRGSGAGLRINPHYWGEKLTCKSREDVKTYSEDRFRQQVIEAVIQAMEDGDLPGLAEAVDRDIFDGREIHYEAGARQALEDFEFYRDEDNRWRDPDFRFVDTFEWDFRTWDWWFLWACHAIVWGIAKYDGRPVPSAPPTPDPAPAADVPAGVRRRSMVTVNLPGGGSDA